MIEGEPTPGLHPIQRETADALEVSKGHDGGHSFALAAANARLRVDGRTGNIYLLLGSIEFRGSARRDQP
jgi:hypothetical protein